MERLMKLNEITGKKCWAILDYDDNSHAHDVTVNSVYLSEKEAQLAYATMWFDMIFDQGDVSQEDEEELNLMVYKDKTFSFKKFEKLAEKQKDAIPTWNDFAESYSIQQTILK